MIPRFAALSIAEITARIPSKLGISEERTCFCIVRRRVTTLRLRSERFNVWRVRLAADLVLSIDYRLLWSWTISVVVVIVLASSTIGAYGLFFHAGSVLGGYLVVIHVCWL